MNQPDTVRQSLVMVCSGIQRLQAKVTMGNINLGNCIVLLCSAYLCCISAQTAPSIGSFLVPGSAPEPSSFTDSQVADPHPSAVPSAAPSESNADPHPSAVPSAAPSESNGQLGRSVSSPTPVSVSLSPKDFPLLPAPIDAWKNSPVPLWWNFPGDQSGAYDSPPTPITPISESDTNTIPQLPLGDSPASAQNRDPPHILMNDVNNSSSLGGGAKAGISLAVIVVVFLAVIGTYVHLTRKQNMKKANTFNEYI